METGYPFFDLSKKQIEASLKSISTRPIYFVDVYGEIGLPELKGCHLLWKEAAQY